MNKKELLATLREMYQEERGARGWLMRYTDALEMAIMEIMAPPEKIAGDYLIVWSECSADTLVYERWLGNQESYKLRIQADNFAWEYYRNDEWATDYPVPLEWRDEIRALQLKIKGEEL